MRTMARRGTIVLLALAGLALAGCAVPSPHVPAGLRPAPPSASAPVAADAPSADEGLKVLPPDWRGSYHAVLKLDANGHGFTSAAKWDAFPAPAAGLLQNAAMLHLRVSWNATIPAGVEVFLRDHDTGELALSGTAPASPTMIDAQASVLKPDTDYDFEARPSGAGGAFVDEEVVAQIVFS